MKITVMIMNIGIAPLRMVVTKEINSSTKVGNCYYVYNSELFVFSVYMDVRDPNDPTTCMEAIRSQESELSERNHGI